MKLNIASKNRLFPRNLALVLVAALGLAACGGDSKSPDPNVPVEPDVPVEVPETYSFDSRFEAGESSVSYSGQTFRQVLIKELVAYISGLTEEIDSGNFVPDSGDVVAELNYFFEFDSDTSGDDPLMISTTPDLLQATFNDISTNKDLVSKIAGRDAKGQHKDWSTEFTGWSGAGGDSPENFLRALFAELDALAVARANGDIPVGPTGAPIANVYVTAKGQDLKQLIEKFLLMAVNYSQGIDDYLDNDLEDHGINSQNTEPGKEGAVYTSLEHIWDEAFGYFGAARDYADYSDDEVAGKGGRDGWATGRHDTNGDGFIDLKSEYNFHAAGNAAKRDRGSSDENPTDFSQLAIDGFLLGRAIISAADGDLSEDDREALVAARDQAVRAWEDAIAATAVHYVNDVLVDMANWVTEDYSFGDHAKHWSEMKAFAIGLQFNPRGQLSDAEFVTVMDLMGDAPVLPGEAGAEAYRQGLLEARGILGAAHGFAESNVENW